MIAGLALTALLVAHHGPAAHRPPPAPISYVVRPGDCLWSIAGATLDDPRLWPQLYQVNRAVIGDNPNLIYPGQQLRLIVVVRGHHRRPRPATSRADVPAGYGGGDPPAGGTPMAQQPAGGPLSGELGCTGLMALWRAAGGRPESAELAASVAMAESGGYQYAHSPTDDYGYWQINAVWGTLATYDAIGNARAAVIISRDGADWTPWTTYRSGAYAGRC